MVWVPCGVFRCGVVLCRVVRSSEGCLWCGFRVTWFGVVWVLHDVFLPLVKSFQVDFRATCFDVALIPRCVSSE